MFKKNFKNSKIHYPTIKNYSPKRKKLKIKINFKKKEKKKRTLPHHDTNNGMMLGCYVYGSQ